MAWHFYSFLVCSSFFLSQWLYSYPTPVDFNGDLLRWKNKKVLGYRIVDEGFYLTEDLLISIRLAARKWGSVEGSSLRLVYDEKDYVMSVFLESSIDGGSYASGYSQFDEIKEDGTIVHCKISVLSDLGGLNFSKTILHEFGHCIGLGHSLIPYSIMSYDFEKNNFALSVDDQAVVARLYPDGKDSVKLPAGCAIGYSGHKVPTHDNRWLLVFILFLPVLGRKRIR